MKTFQLSLTTSYEGKILHIDTIGTDDPIQLVTKFSLAIAMAMKKLEEKKIKYDDNDIPF